MQFLLFDIAFFPFLNIVITISLQHHQFFAPPEAKSCKSLINSAFLESAGCLAKKLRTAAFFDKMIK